MSKQVKPPYLTAGKIETLLRLLSTRNYQKLSTIDLKNRDFSPTDAIIGIQALLFLHLIDTEGNVAENAKKLQLQGPERELELAKIVKEAYSKLFEIVPDANKLSRGELHNEFLSVYGLSPRLAKSAVPAFLFLCNKANLPVEQEIVLRSKNTKSTKPLKHITPTHSSEIHTQSSANDKGMQAENNELFPSLDFNGLKLVITSSDWLKRLGKNELKEIIEALEKIQAEIEDGTKPNTDIIEGGKEPGE